MHSSSNVAEKLGIIVLNYNNYKLTREMVNEILKNEFFQSVKIVIVDNASPNESYAVLSKEFENRVPVIKTEKNGGYSYGNNVGIKYLRDNYPDVRYCAICNPDVILNDVSVKKMLKFMQEHSDIKLLGCVATDIDNNIQKYCWKQPGVMHEIFSSEIICNRFIRKSTEYTNEELSKEFLYVDVALGAFFIAEMDALFEVDLLSEDTFLYCEEQILTHRLKQKGYQIGVLNTCSYIHNHIEPTSMKKKTLNYMNHQKSKLIYLKTCCHINYATELLFKFISGIGIIERKVLSLFIK